MSSAAFAQQATTENAAGAAAETAAEATEQAGEAAKDAAADAANGEAATEEKPAEGAAAEGAAAEGAAAEGAAAEGQAPQQQQDPTYVKETIEDWELKCFRADGKTETPEDPCQMFQLLKEDNGNPIAEFSIVRLKNGGQAVAGATVVVPLGTLLTQPLKITIDSGPGKTFPYSFCSMIGCYSQIGLTAEDIASLKNGATAVLQIVPAQAPDQKVDIKASLTGFTAAYEKTSVMGQ